MGYGLMTNLFSFGADPVKGADPGNTFFSFSVTLGIELCFFFFNLLASTDVCALLGVTLVVPVF